MCIGKSMVCAHTHTSRFEKDSSKSSFSSRFLSYAPCAHAYSFCHQTLLESGKYYSLLQSLSLMQESNPETPGPLTSRGLASPRPASDYAVGGVECWEPFSWRSDVSNTVPVFYICSCSWYTGVIIRSGRIYNWYKPTTSFCNEHFTTAPVLWEIFPFCLSVTYLGSVRSIYQGHNYNISWGRREIFN